ncbi:MAG: S8 family serine peptidase [Candidatus Hodarchaeales archaeon]|jgi:subtilisin family serine protease
MKKKCLLTIFMALMVLIAVNCQHFSINNVLVAGKLAILPQKSSFTDLSWNLQLVNASEAWEVTKGSRDVIVAIIDTGIDFDHPELQHAIWQNPGEIAGNGIDDDSNGYIDDVHGYDFYNGDPDPSGDHHHGTFVAGIIASLHDGLGIDGLAPNITFMPIKYLNEENRGSTWDAFGEAIDYAVDNGADIISMSIQSDPGSTPPSSFAARVNAAVGAGMLLVSVTGNHEIAEISYPGRYNSVIAVTAVDKEMKGADFANYGSETELAAPGVSVESTTLINAGLNTTLLVNQQHVSVYPIEHTIQTGLSGMNAPMVDVGFGLAGDFDGLNVSGKIALISRGQIYFKEKADNAAANGAVAAIVYNNQPGDFSDWTFYDESPTWNPPSIPGVAISQDNGLVLVENLSLGHDLDTRLWIVPSNYSTTSGTSFATPLVTAAAALMLSINPSLKGQPEQVRTILTRTALDLGDPGRDNTYGWGLLDAGLAVKAAKTTDTEPPDLDHGFEIRGESELVLNYTLRDDIGIHKAQVYYRLTNTSQSWKNVSLLAFPVLNSSIETMKISLGEIKPQDLLEYYFTIEDLWGNVVMYPASGMNAPFTTDFSKVLTQTTVAECDPIVLLLLVIPVLTIVDRRKKILKRR